jgi:hypothetical protein
LYGAVFGHVGKVLECWEWLTGVGVLELVG